MPDPNMQTQNSGQSLPPQAHSFSAGEWLLIIGIITLAVGAFVRLEMRVNQLDPSKVREEQESALRAIKSVSPTSLDVPLGTVIASILKPAKFQELYGDRWTLADGRNIIGTPLSTAIQKDSIPDLGGQFLRAINTKDDPKTQDPEGTREPGHPQLDTLKSHTHNITVGNTWMETEMLTAIAGATTSLLSRRPSRPAKTKLGPETRRYIFTSKSNDRSQEV